MAPTRARRKRIATSKVVDNNKQAKEAKIAKIRGRGDRRGGGKA